jgi:hypothetical protein
MKESNEFKMKVAEAVKERIAPKWFEISMRPEFSEESLKTLFDTLMINVIDNVLQSVNIYKGPLPMEAKAQLFLAVSEMVKEMGTAIEDEADKEIMKNHLRVVN